MLTSSLITVERFVAALAERTWSLGGDGRSRLFQLTAGNAVLCIADSEECELRSPSLLWIPQTTRGRLRVVAGSEGFVATVTPGFVQHAVSDPGLTVHIHPLLDRVVLAGPEMLGARASGIARSFEVLVCETETLSPTAAQMMSLHLAIILLSLWRSADVARETSTHGAGVSLVQRYRQLVELHYRESLRVCDYASRLGVTREQLHSACLRATKRTPLELVHERLVSEARARLEQTDLSVEQIGYGIGFRDPGYFNRFFKRLTGHSPGAYRRLSTSVRRSVGVQSFAAWP